MISFILTMAVVGLLIGLLDLRKRQALTEERLRLIFFEVRQLRERAEAPPPPAAPAVPSAAPMRWRDADAPPPPAPEPQPEPQAVPARVSPFAVAPTAPAAVEPEPQAPPLDPAPVEPQPVEPEPVEPAPVAPPPAETPGAKAAPNPPAPPFSLEDLFGRRLPIWVGGITLIVAAVLLVKYTIETGLVTPAVRVMLGLIFGTGLIAGAEGARRAPALAADPRVGQALAGAGVGSLYASVLAAANLYTLIAPEAAFVALSLVTGLAMLLALRFGAPTAVLALVGGLATPALVGANAPNIPVLAGYLGVVIGSLGFVSLRQRWFWLGIAAMVGGGGWILFVTSFFRLGSGDVLALGLLALLFGFVLPAQVAPERRMPLQAGAALFASLQIALIVVQGGFAPLSWGLYALLAVALHGLTLQMPALRPLRVLPLATSFALVALWPAPPLGLLAAVLVVTALIAVVPALVSLARHEGDWLETGLLIAAALGGFGLWVVRAPIAHHLPSAEIAIAALAFAAPLGLGVALRWRDPSRPADARFVALLAATAALLLAAALFGLPFWSTPVAAVLITAGVRAARRSDDYPLIGLVLRSGLAAATLLLVVSAIDRGELARLALAVPLPALAPAVLRWGAVTVLAILLAGDERRRRKGAADPSYQRMAAVLGYGLLAQFVPLAWLPITLALIALALTLAAERALIGTARAARLMLALIILAWGAQPLLLWLASGLRSLAAEPMLVTGVPALTPLVMRLLIPALLLAVALARSWQSVPALGRAWAAGALALVGMVGTHSLYKRLFAIADAPRFADWGLAERTLWELLLIAAGLLLWRARRWRQAALLLPGAAAVHWFGYSLLLHNPLFATQAVGALPFANLLLPSCAVPALAAWLMLRIEPDARAALDKAVQLGAMALITLFGYLSLRQLFTGSLLNAPGLDPAESVLRSVLAIALAIGFLLWGIRARRRLWRLASLVLMTLAVAKVFLVDAAGLEGLLRIASFMALGFSLIGIGWLYSRTLRG